MPFSKQLPAPVSHLKARLRAFKRPMVWGPSIILLLIVFFTVEYWLNPQWFENTPSTANAEGGFNPSISSEDGAIGADIDSLPLLLNQLNGTPNSQATDQNQQQDKVAKKPSLFDELLKSNNPAAALDKDSKPSNGLSSPPTASPLLSSTSGVPGQSLVGSTPGLTGLPGTSSPTVPAGSLLTSPSVPTTSASLGLPSTSGTSAPAPVSALQTAIEQSQLQNNSTVTAPNATPAAGSGNSATTPTVTNQTFNPSNALAPSGNSGINYSATPGVSSAPSGNSFNYLTQPQPDSTVPVGIAPVVPTAPSIAPVVPSSNLRSNFRQSSFQGNQNNGFNNSGFSGNAGLQPSQLNQQPFSVPRRVPGRNIGGGEINTFSNP